MPSNAADWKKGETFSRLQYEPPQRPVSFIEQLSSSVRLESILVSTAIAAAEERPPAEAGFYWAENLRPGEELRARDFAAADPQSLEEMQQVRDRIDIEERARYLRENGPLSSLLTDSIAILGFDPTTFLGFGSAVVAGRGLRLGSRLAFGGAAGAFETGAAELALQATQDTRTTAESLSALMLGGAFGIGLGTLGAVAAGRAAKAEARAIKDFVAIGRDAYPEEAVARVGDEAPEPASAAITPREIEPEETIVAGGPVVRAIIRGIAQLKRIGLAAPTLELSVSRFANSRRLIRLLADTGIISEGEVRGLTPGSTLTTRLKSYDGIAVKTIQGVRTAYNAYKKRDGKLNQREFYEEITKAGRRGDVHELPEVAETMKEVREKVFDPLFNAAKKAPGNLVPEDVRAVQGAESYMSRIYNREKIAEDRIEFQNAIAKWLRRTFKEEDLAAEGELDEIADAIIDKIMGAPEGRLPIGIKIGRRGPLKERTFNIPDLDIEPWLESNILDIVTRYIRTVAADVEFSKMFGRLDLESEIGKLRDEAKAQIKAAKTGKERKLINDRMESEAALLTKLAERIRGVDAAPFDPRMFGMQRLGRVARNLNFVRLLGSVMLSSIPDIGRIVMEEGLFRTSGILFDELARGFKGIRLAGDEARAAGTATDMILSTRIRAILDLGDRYAAESRMERGLNVGTRFFGLITLLDPWNNALKSITSAVAGTRILKTIEAVGRGEAISKRDLRKLAQAGISQDMARRIARQSQHWERNGAVVLGNTEAWTDQIAVRTFRDALLRDVDNTIITPHVGDAPLWTSTEWGKTIFQFKKFAMASTQRTLISGLQGKDMAAMNGIMLMVALGGLGTAFRDFSRDLEVKERTTRVWINESIDRSGALSVFYEFDSLLDRVSLSPTRALAGEPASRFLQRPVLSTLLGPSAGFLEDAGLALRGFLTGEFTQGDLHRAVRLAPGHNVFWGRYAFSKAEEGISRHFGLPKREPRKRQKTKRKVVAPTER